MENSGIEFANAVYLALILSGVPLLFSSAVSLVVTIIQAATTVQEQSVLVLCKFCAVFTVLFFLGGLGLNELVDFCRSVLEGIPERASAFGQ